MAHSAVSDRTEYTKGTDCMSNKQHAPEAGRCIMGFPEDYVVLDLETTGLSADRCEIIELGAAKVRGHEVTRTYSLLVRPSAPINPFITQLTGISNYMVADAPPIEQALPDFLDFVGDGIVAGHNVTFDIRFLRAWSQRVLGCGFTNDYVDTMRLSRRLFPQERHHRLCDLEARFGLKNRRAHRALSDVLLTNDCLEYMRRWCGERDVHL